MSSYYEELTAPEYWDGPLSVVEPLGWLATHVDNFAAARTGIASDIEENFYDLKDGGVRALLVEPGEELPLIDPDRPGLVRIVLDERRRRQMPDGAPFTGPTPDNIDTFNARAHIIDEHRFTSTLPAHISVPTPGTDEGQVITRSLIYARTAPSDRQLIGMKSTTVDRLAEEEWGKTPARGARIVLPRFQVGAIYQHDKKGQVTETRVSHAELLTPLYNVPERDRGVGGKKITTLEWIRRHAVAPVGSA